MEAQQEPPTTPGELGVKRTLRLVSCGVVADCRKQEAVNVSGTRRRDFPSL